MRTNFSAWLLKAAVGLSLTATMASSEVVTLSQAYDRLVESQIEYELIAQDLEISEHQVRQALGQRLPRVELQVGYEHINQTVVSSDNTAFATGQSQFPKISVTLRLEQPIFDASKFRALPLARAQNVVVQFEAQQARNRVVRDFALAYFSAARAQLELKRAELIVRGRREYEEVIAEEIAAGRREEDSLLAARGETLSAEGDVTFAEVDLLDALTGLQRYSGVDITGVSLSQAQIGSVDLVNLRSEFTADRLNDMSLALAAAKARLEVARRAEHRTKGENLPRVDFSLAFEQQMTEGSLFGGGSNTRNMTAGVLFTVPIYEGGIKRARIKEARANIKAEELRILQTERALRARYDALMSANAAAGERTTRVRRQLGLAAQGVLAAEEKYRVGRAHERVVLEQKLRRDALRIDLNVAQLQQVRIQAEIYALFGALDLVAVAGG